MIKPILSLIVLILSIVFSIFYVKPEYDRVQSARADLGKLSGIAEDTDKIKALIKQTGEILNAVDADVLARFNVFLPEKLDPIRFANNLQSLALKNGIILSGIKVEERKIDTTSKPTTKPVAKSVDGVGGASSAFSITGQPFGADVGKATGVTVSEEKYVVTKTSFLFSTTYPGLLLFLKDLEKSLGLINVTSLSFKPLSSSTTDKKPKEALTGLYQFTIEIETYSLK